VGARDKGRIIGCLLLFLFTLAVTSLFTGAATPPPPQQQRTPTFATDIAPIVFGNCVSCHRPGQAGPFPLLSYDDVKKHADEIVDVTSAREMPPWHATRAEGFAEFRDERRLTDQQIDTIRKWVDAGTPSGDLKLTPMPPSFPLGWMLGIPDLILTMPRVMPVPASGPDLYRNVTLSIDLPIDRWITAIEYQPSARSVVHHALFFIAPADANVQDDDVVPGLGRTLSAPTPLRPGARLGAADESFGGLGGWVPGVTPKFFPDGIAQPLPSHTNIVMQLHLHPNGKAQVEDGRVALYFSKMPPQKSLTGIQVPPAFGFAIGIDIPAGEGDYTLRDSFELPVEVEAYGARGHAHYLGRDMKMTARLPTGQTRGLLWISRWDFSWQDTYYFKSPVRLPKGTKVDVEIKYDNSASNPRNPHAPPERVKWGRESTDEMGSMTLIVTAPNDADTRTLRAAQAQHFRQQLLKRLQK
jgi:mono/diheme cytochrome c family protein